MEKYNKKILLNFNQMTYLNPKLLKELLLGLKMTKF